MTLKDKIARVVDRDAFKLPKDAVEGPGWEMRRQFAQDKAARIIELTRRELAFIIDDDDMNKLFGESSVYRQVRHKVRGTTYDVLGNAEGQVSKGTLHMFGKNGRFVSEGDRITVYCSQDDGKLWWRFPDEFEDGRFEDVV
jgi:hypothetical protein